MILFDEWTVRGKWGVTSSFKPPAAAVVVHHSVTPVTDNAVRDAQTVEQVIYDRRYQSGFAMVAYNYLLHPNGTVLEGRGPWGGGKGWRNGANKNERGGSLSNTNTVSVCLIGDYRTDTVTSAQRASFRQLLSDLRRDGIVAVDSVVVPHSNLAYTECPSAGFDQLITSYPPVTEDEEETDMVTLHDTTTGEAWVVAGNMARKLYDADGWLAQWEGPVRSHPNMRFVIGDLYTVA